MPALSTNPEVNPETDDLADLWETPADSPILKDAESIYSALQSHAPEVLIPIGMAHMCQSAVLQSTDTKVMSATFTILTRPKKTELNRGGRMVQIAPGPLGAGMKTENYAANPVVLFNHGMEGFVFPLGLSQDKSGKLTVKCSQKSMIGTVYFSQKCPYAESIYGMVDDGLIRMSSAGFNVEQMALLDMDQKLPPNVYTPLQVAGQRAFDCTQSDLIEWSVVVAGADAGALRQCCETGKWKGNIIRPQLIPVLRQYAETKQAWGIGFGTGTIHQEQVQSSTVGNLPVNITVDRESIDRFSAAMNASVKTLAELTQQITTLAANFATQSPQVKTPQDAGAVIAPTQPQVVQQIDFTTLGKQIASEASRAVAAEFRPIRDAQTKLTERIDQLTGKLPD